ncbi:MAG: Gfo/Idh/MocA family oxidoreductase [Chloroflexota bacterium]|nr:Gfo/Idh/MocA family oxidoreductase [Chloroflexota bacterium]MDE2908872.1 Gfo/Idh/MocA family oxidoreductase [Chloroflexota bacterium]
MGSENTKVGVIGTGAIGGVHTENLMRRTLGATVVAVMDIDQERANAVAAGCGGARVYADAGELISDPTVDAVLIASTDHTHADFAIACLEAGKPVLCEKPLATTMIDAERVVRAELAVGRRLLQVGFMREYDHAHRDLVDLLQGGAIGAALKFRGVHINPVFRRKLTIESVITNSLIHDIHSARWIMGDEIRSAYVQWAPADPARPRSARLADIQVIFESGAIGSLEYNGDSGYGYEVTVEVTGETGRLTTASHPSPALRQSGTLSRAITPNWPERFPQAYVDEVQDWIDAIRRNEATGPSAWDGYMSLVVAQAAIRSAETGKPQPTNAGDKPPMYH